MVPKVNTLIKNFSSCAFKMNLPLIERQDNKIQISYQLTFNFKARTDVILHNVIIKNATGSHDFDVFFLCHALKLEERVSFIIPYTGPLAGSKIYFEYIQEDGKILEAVYKLDKNKKANFEGVSTSVSSPAMYSEKLKKCPVVHEEIHASLIEYKKAVLQEMKFLKEEGGRKYKVTNGRFISVIENMYSYGFDLETELSISEDAPVTLHLVLKTVNGVVLTCEGFHLILLIEENVGERIETAHISAAPWKLLQALHNRIDLLNKNHRIANILIENKASGSGDISDIRKGQETAITIAQNDPIEIIWGPPGTGKTYTMAQIAIQFLQKGKTVLMVSHSNISVDGFVVELADKIRNFHDDLNRRYLNQGFILRYGYVKSEKLIRDEYAVAFNYAIKREPLKKARMNKLLEERDSLTDIFDARYIEIDTELKNIRASFKQAEKDLASNAKLLATTISKVSIDKIFDDKQYDVVMFDEASMAYVPQVIEAAMYAKEHFICVGDFRQLSPIAQSSAKNVLNKDIFSYLGIIDRSGNLKYHPWLVMLNEQRRMHPKISEFSNKRIYGGLLEDHESTLTSRNSIVNSSPFSGFPLTLIDLSGTYSLAGRNSDNSRFNILSATISFLTAVEAVRKGNHTVGIITPYAAQARLIQAMIIDHGNGLHKKVSCSTVHQFQGSERDVIIFDGVESYPSKKPGILMSNNDNESLSRLINVAVTRAKGKLIVIADYRYWNDIFSGQGNTFYSLISYVKKNGHVISAANGSLNHYIEDIKKTGNIGKSLNYKDIADDVYKHIKKAKNRILISLADSQISDADDLYKQLDLQMDYGVLVAGKTNDYKLLDKSFKKKIWHCDEKCFPLMLIDNDYLYYHVPDTKGLLPSKDHHYFVTCPIYLKIKGHNTIEIIKSLTDMEYKYSAGIRTKIETTPSESGGMDVSVNSAQTMMSGLALYVYENQKCPKCKKPLLLSKGRSGKKYLRCSNNSCDHSEFLDFNLINEYIEENDVCCPMDGGELKAGVSRNGLYIRCSCGHFIDPTLI